MQNIDIDLQVYPNPFVDHLNLAFNTSVTGDVVVHLHDVTGQLIDTKVSKAKQEQRIDLGHLAKAQYLLTPPNSPTLAKRYYHNYWAYILANKPRGTLYIGVTGGLDDRMERHMRNEGSKFTAKYNVKQLVYFEEFQYVLDAVARENN